MGMNITVDVLVDIDECVRSARITQGLNPYQTTRIGVDRWLGWLHSEHSQIRVMQLRVGMHSIPYYVAMHLVRHTQGVLPFVRSQRPTSLMPVGYDRRSAPQNALVDYCPVLNPQSLINISRRRLCAKADPATIKVWQEVKRVIAAHENPYVAAIAATMMADCEYRGGVCHELSTCGKYAKWSDTRSRDA